MKITEVLTADEMALVTSKSDLWGTWMVLCQWAMVIGIFWVAAYWTNPLTVIVGTLLLGGRQLGFGVLGHECGHRTLFRTRWLNDFVGDWIVSPPRFSNNKAYMRGHLQHHRLAGTPDDPDLNNYKDYPITTERLKRKLTRDLTGQTGYREVKRIGQGIINIHKLSAEARAALLRGVVATLLMLGILIAFGEGWLFLMWIAAYIFVQPLLSRIRQVAEHAAVPDRLNEDPRLNTRTVYASPIERCMFAPNKVNWHLEHHMLASVPAYRLRTLHNLLRARGFYDGVDFPNGYLKLLRKVTTPTPVPA